jgi:hypothetical protein
MKNFLKYLQETTKIYQFRIKIANTDIDTAKKSAIKSVLESYGLKSISSAKRLPITETNLDFPNKKNCQITLIEVELEYPFNDAQLKAVVSSVTGIIQDNIVVVPTAHPEELWRTGDSKEINKFEKGKSLLDQPKLEDTNPEMSKELSKRYANAEPIFKELSNISYKQDTKLKTINDTPVGTTSPIGSK